MTAPRWKWVAHHEEGAPESWALASPSGVHHAWVRFEARRYEAGALPWKVCAAHREPRWYATRDAAMTALEEHVTALLNPVALCAERPKPPPPPPTKWVWTKAPATPPTHELREDGRLRAVVARAWINDDADLYRVARPDCGSVFVKGYDVHALLRELLGPDVPNLPA